MGACLYLLMLFISFEINQNSINFPLFGKKSSNDQYTIPDRLKRDSAEQPIKCLIVEDGIIPSTHSDSFGKPAGPALKYGDEYRVLDFDQDTLCWFLCKVAGGRIIPVGWIQNSDVLFFEEGLLKCLHVPTTMIQRKAFFIGTGNRVGSFKGLSNLTCKLGTRLQAVNGKPVSSYNIFYVFKEKCNEKGEVSKLLLGIMPEVAPEKVLSLQDALFGWFDAENFWRFDNREFLEFDVASTQPNLPPAVRRTKSSPLFETADDAEVAAQKKSIDGLKVLPSLEMMDDNGCSIPFQKNTYRFPIFNINKRRSKHPIQGNLFEIGFFNTASNRFERGFIWEYDQDKKRQVRIKLLMSDRELGKTEELVGLFLQNAKRAGKNEDLGQIVVESLVRLVADDKKQVDKLNAAGNDEKSIAEAITKKHGIHLESYLFNRALNQIGKMTFNETLQELNKIQYKLILLQDLQNKQKREFIEEKDEDAKPGVIPEKVIKWRVKAGAPSTTVDRFFKLQATDAKTLSYIWLDLEDELP